MKLLIKSALILAALFASTFIIIKLTGILTIEDIKLGFETLRSQPVYFIGGLVVLLLFADLFIAVPTMTVIIFAGYFIGFHAAVMFAFTGLACAALTGYVLSRLWGDKLLRFINRDQQQRQQMHELFQEHGILVLILSRAMPILPEVSACLAGVSKMDFSRFALGWSLGSVPYVLLVAYAGSISDLNNPMPAVFVAIAVTTTLWLAWYWFFRVKIKVNS